MKTHPIMLDRERTLSYGVQEMRECSRITGKDPLRNGQHWISGLTVNNISELAVVLLRREDPTITPDMIEKLLEETPDEIVNTIGLAFVELIKPPVVPPSPITPSDTPTNGGPSVDSISA